MAPTFAHNCAAWLYLWDLLSPRSARTQLFYFDRNSPSAPWHVFLESGRKLNCWFTTTSVILLPITLFISLYANHVISNNESWNHLVLTSELTLILTLLYCGIYDSKGNIILTIQVTVVVWLILCSRVGN